MLYLNAYVCVCLYANLFKDKYMGKFGVQKQERADVGGIKRQHWEKVKRQTT